MSRQSCPPAVASRPYGAMPHFPADAVWTGYRRYAQAPAR